jgi:hypothetical protein
MKSFRIIVAGFVLMMSCLVSVESSGQKRQGPPTWAHAKGHHQQARYVYFPQHNFYYDMHRSLYVYAEGPHWYTKPVLPALYASIDLGNSLQVALDFYGDRPYMDNDDHMEKHHYRAHHKAWKKQHKEWEKREKEWARQHEKHHKKCAGNCRDYRSSEGPSQQDRPGGRVSVDIRF